MTHIKSNKDILNERLIWDVCKIHREFSVKYCGTKSKKRKYKIQALQDRISTLDKLLAVNPNTEIHKERKSLKN